MATTDHETPSAAVVWFLSGDELAATRAKLAKLQHSVTRKGFTGSITLDAVPATRTEQSPGGLPVTVHGFEVTITGEPPRYAGWRFVAAVDAVDGGAVLRYPPGSPATIPNDQVRPGECDHCHTQRSRRSTVLVAHDDTGQLLQVGRSCLKDFLGHNVAPVFLTVDDVRGDLQRGLSGTPTAWDTDSVLTYAGAAVEALGWTPSSASDYGRQPTRDVVRLALAGGRGSDQLLGLLAPHLEEARARAPVVRDELLNGLTGTTGYEANLTAVLRGDAVDSQHLGLAVSAIAAHQRLIHERHTEAVRHEAAAAVDYVGAVGEKVTLTGTVRTAMRVDGFTYRSPDNMLLVVDCGAAVAKMTTTAAWAYHLKPGDVLTVTGTVKAHREWNGIKQTVLTRPKQLDPTPGQPLLGDALPAARWETVQTAAPDGASTARRATVRTPTPGFAPSR